MSSALSWPPEGVETVLGPQAPDPSAAPDTPGGLPLYREVIPRVVNVASPAAGADWAASPEGGKLWHVQSVIFTLVTDANVATRIPELAIGDGTTNFCFMPVPQGITAGVTRRYEFLRGTGFLGQGVAATPRTDISFLTLVPVLGGQRIGSAMQLIQVGDQFSAIALYVYEVSWMPIPDASVYPPGALTYRREYGSHLLREVN